MDCAAYVSNVFRWLQTITDRFDALAALDGACVAAPSGSGDRKGRQRDERIQWGEEDASHSDVM